MGGTTITTTASTKPTSALIVRPSDQQPFCSSSHIVIAPRTYERVPRTGEFDVAWTGDVAENGYSVIGSAGKWVRDDVAERQRG